MNVVMKDEAGFERKKKIGPEGSLEWYNKEIFKTIDMQGYLLCGR